MDELLGDLPGQLEEAEEEEEAEEAEAEADGDEPPPQPSRRYLPPAARARAAAGGGADEQARLSRAVRGLLNRLGEENAARCAQELSALAGPTAPARELAAAVAAEAATALRTPSSLAPSSSFTGMDSIMRVQANGAITLERTFLRAPSIARMRERPTMPILAAA